MFPVYLSIFKCIKSQKSLGSSEPHEKRGYYMDGEISMVEHHALDYIVDVERIEEKMNIPLRLITRSTQA